MNGIHEKCQTSRLNQELLSSCGTPLEKNEEKNDFPSNSPWIDLCEKVIHWAPWSSTHVLFFFFILRCCFCCKKRYWSWYTWNINMFCGMSTSIIWYTSFTCLISCVFSQSLSPDIVQFLHWFRNTASVQTFYFYFTSCCFTVIVVDTAWTVNLIIIVDANISSSETSLICILQSVDALKYWRSSFSGYFW